MPTVVVVVVVVVLVTWNVHVAPTTGTALIPFTSEEIVLGIFKIKKHKLYNLFQI